MGEFGIAHWIVVLAIILILFGGRKIPEVMKGLGEGIRNFKDGMAGGSSNNTTSQNTMVQAPTPTEKPAEEKKLG